MERKRVAEKLKLEAMEVAAALDIYYMRYHSILRELERGEGERLARELLGERGDLRADARGGGKIFRRRLVACRAGQHHLRKERRLPFQTFARDGGERRGGKLL